MRRTTAVVALLFGCAAVSDLLAQGQLRWGNLFTGVVRAPIYGPEPTDSTRIIRGNGPSPSLPAGNAVYTGALLQGIGFTMGLFLGNDVAEAAAAMDASATASFRTGAAAGFMNIFEYTEPTRMSVSAQFRAWDNQMGTVTAWAQVMAAGGLIPAGLSDPFVVGLLGADFGTTDTTGIRSFNLTVVPEPSLIALGALGLGALLLRRRK